MKKIIICTAILVLGTLACEDKDNLPDQFLVEVNDAHNLDVISFASYQSEFVSKQRRSSINGFSDVHKFDITNFPASDLKELRVTYGDLGNSTYAIQSTVDSNLSLSVSFGADGKVNGALYSETIITGDVRESKIYDVNGVLKIHFSINVKTGQRTIYKSPNPQESGWFDDFLDSVESFVMDTSECLGDLWTPTDMVVFDAAFTAAASVATGGWFVPVSIAACGIKVALD